MRVFYKPKAHSNITNFPFEMRIENNTITLDDGVEVLNLNLLGMTAAECYQLSDIISNIAHSKDPIFNKEIPENE